jgi:glycosyltransferase involved in cell wall biosynthesis
MIKYHREHSYYLYTPAVNPTLFDPGCEIRLPEKFRHKMFPSFWRTFGITPELEKEKISIYHGLSGEIPHKINRKNIRSVVTIHDLIFLRYPELYSNIDRSIYRKKFLYACNNADKIIAISEQTKTDIINFFNIDEARIEVLYQGCQEIFQKMVPSEEKQLIKAKYNLPDEYLLYVGTIEKRKNLLSVVKAIYEGNIDITLVVIGKQTKYSAQVSEYIVKNKMENVRFLEGVTNIELPAIYQSSTLFIYPSLFEGFGIPVIEALYSGVPVITSKGGCFSEAGGPETCYADTKNPEEIADSIKKLLSDKPLREKMITEGLTYVQKFDHRTLANQLNQIYLSL